jgi:hypothetical protein
MVVYITLGVDVYEAIVIPHVMVVPIYIPLPLFIYSRGQGS